MGAVHGHGFRKTPTEMPVGLTEIVQVGRRMLGAGLHSERTGQVRSLRGWTARKKEAGRG